MGMFTRSRAKETGLAPVVQPLPPTRRKKKPEEQPSETRAPPPPSSPPPPQQQQPPHSAPRKTPSQRTSPPPLPRLPSLLRTPSDTSPRAQITTPPLPRPLSPNLAHEAYAAVNSSRSSSVPRPHEPIHTATRAQPSRPPLPRPLSPPPAHNSIAPANPHPSPESQKSSSLKIKITSTRDLIIPPVTNPASHALGLHIRASPPIYSVQGAMHYLPPVQRSRTCPGASNVQAITQRQSTTGWFGIFMNYA